MLKKLEILFFFRGVKIHGLMSVIAICDRNGKRKTRSKNLSAQTICYTQVLKGAYLNDSDGKESG
jgi:hypothetical protein